jgi:hypothetical protein
MSYDPYAAKLAANNATTTNPVQSQYYAPVGTAAAPPGGTVVMPAAQSHGYSHQPGEPVRAPPVAYAQRAPPGRWKDGICDWCNNLYPSCYCACCCFYGMWLVGQSKLPKIFAVFVRFSRELSFSRTHSGPEDWIYKVFNRSGIGSTILAHRNYFNTGYGCWCVYSCYPDDILVRGGYCPTYAHRAHGKHYRNWAVLRVLHRFLVLVLLRRPE